MKKFGLIFILIIGLLSCNSQEDYHLNLIFENADGLTTETDIYHNKDIIGKIASIEKFENKFLAKIKFNEETKIPFDSGFEIVNLDLLETKGIKVTFSNNATTYSNHDTITVALATTSLSNEVIKIENVDSVFRAKGGDTAIYEVYPDLKQ